MELSTKQKGDLTELQCITACYQMGYSVSIPWGENNRYDFILDIGNKLVKVQCKTCREIENGKAIQFNCCSINKNNTNCERRSYNKEQIDYFATYYQGECYFIPVEECGIKTKTLRHELPKNGQVKGISLLENYRLNKIMGD